MYAYTFAFILEADDMLTVALILFMAVFSTIFIVALWRLPD
jgi:hypothetical protein